MKVMLLEDDRSLRELITEELERNGYHVNAFRDGDSAMDSLYNTLYDLMLLDINVPGIDGYEFLRMLRESGNNTPAMIISSYTDIDHLSKGYELGCNDYLRKPFSLKEMLLRIQALLKTHRFASQSDIITLSKGFSFHIASGELQGPMGAVNLTAKERRFIELLVQHRNRVVTIEEIMDYVWDESVNLNNLRVLIYKLRQKLDEELIQNIKHMGYRII